MRFIVFFASMWLLLPGCAPLSTTASSPAGAESWPQRARVLSALSFWQCRASMVVKSPTQKWSADVFWQQRQGDYTVQVLTFLGIEVAALQGNAQHMRIKNARGQVVEAQMRIEDFMQHELGWSLPVSALSYWLRGLPAPGAVTLLQQDALHRLAVFYQQGWRVQFVRYSRVQEMDLPQEMVFTHAEYTVHWTIAPASWEFSKD